MSQHIKTWEQRMKEAGSDPRYGTTERYSYLVDEIADLRAELARRPDSGKVAEAYGILWHVNAGMDAPAGLGVISVTPEKAAYQARNVLRDMLTNEQRGKGIEAARSILCAPAADSAATEQAGTVQAFVVTEGQINTALAEAESQSVERAAEQDGQAFDAAIASGALRWDHKDTARAVAYAGFKAGRAALSASAEKGNQDA